jgi:hypothetical protein
LQLDDITVEVRDKNLARQGLIRPEDLNFEMTVPHSNVGTWKLRLAAGHPLAETLRTPGSGLVVTGPDGETIMSGPTVKPTFVSVSEDPGGTVAFDGVTDNILLADMLAWPDPSNPDVTTQAFQYDQRSGAAETVMHAYVNVNIGPGAPVPRRNPLIVMGNDMGRGNIVVKSARFPMLGELVGEVAVVADLGFHLIQRGSNLVFETYEIVDRVREIRLDVQNNTLSAQKLVVAAPEVTRVIVVGKGDGTASGRSLHPFSNTKATDAETAWGRRIERVHGQTQTNDSGELQQGADERLAEKGFTQVAVEVVPMDGETMRLGRDWNLGDRVTVVVDGNEYISVVTGYSIRVTDEGFFVSATLGDPTVFDPNVALRRRVQRSEQRLSAIERNG